MRKTITQPVSKDTSRSSERWLNLEPLAQVEVTSEEAANPVESALIPGPGPGWRAEQPGEQDAKGEGAEVEPRGAVAKREVLAQERDDRAQRRLHVHEVPDQEVG